MAYQKRVYTDTTEVVTYVDMNRIEEGIAANDEAVSLKVEKSVYDEKVKELEDKNTKQDTELSKKVSEETYATDKSELDRAIAAKNTINGIETNVNFIGAPTRYPAEAYGIRVDLRNNTITRLGSAVGKTLDDFMDIAPWNGKLEVIEGQYMKNFELTYYKRVPLVLEDVEKTADNNEIGKQLVVWEDWISMYPFDDMYVHPTFQRPDFITNQMKVVDCFYFSRFEGSIYDTSASKYLLADEQVADFNNDLLCSIPNAKPCSGKTQNLTIENARKLANNRTSNSDYVWGQQDFSSVSYLQLLLTIACASYDSQASIGQGAVNIEDTPNTENNSLKTGSTLSMGFKCGSAGENGKSSVNFFGIENFWGNVWKFVDGFNIEAKNIHHGWISNNNLAVNTNTNKDNLGFTISKTNGYMNRMGYDENIDFSFIPTKTTGGGLLAKDYLYQNKTYNGFLIARLGGSWDSGGSAGCFCWSAYASSASRNRDVSCRLVCIKK